jgi:surface polysaccharide O-acyltransferase-like enzyme
MSIAIFILIKSFHFKTDGILYKWIKRFSGLSFGIYLSHMLVYKVLLVHIYQIFGISILIQLLVIPLLFILSALLTFALGKLPIKKYVIG